MPSLTALSALTAWVPKAPAGLGLAAGLLLAMGLWWPAAALPALSWTAPGGTRWLLQGDQGVWWQGSARLVPAEGAAAEAPVTRLDWQLSPGWEGLSPVLRLRLQPRSDAGAGPDAASAQALDIGFRLHQGGVQWRASDVQSRWPAAWLEPLGLPVHDLGLQGHVWVRTLGLSGGGGRSPAGVATADILLRPTRADTPIGLSHYELSWEGQGETAQLQLRTRLGDLQLSGLGGPTAQGWRFRGTAQAQGAAAALRPFIEAPRGPGQTALFSWIQAS